MTAFNPALISSSYLGGAGLGTQQFTDLAGMAQRAQQFQFEKQQAAIRNNMDAQRLGMEQSRLGMDQESHDWNRVAFQMAQEQEAKRNSLAWSMADMLEGMKARPQPLAPQAPDSSMVPDQSQPDQNASVQPMQPLDERALEHNRNIGRIQASLAHMPHEALLKVFDRMMTPQGRSELVSESNYLADGGGLNFVDPADKAMYSAIYAAKGPDAAMQFAVSSHQRQQERDYEDRVRAGNQQFQTAEREAGQQFHHSERIDENQFSEHLHQLGWDAERSRDLAREEIRRADRKQKIDDITRILINRGHNEQTAADTAMLIVDGAMNELPNSLGGSAGQHTVAVKLKDGTEVWGPKSANDNALHLNDAAYSGIMALAKRRANEGWGNNGSPEDIKKAFLSIAQEALWDTREFEKATYNPESGKWIPGQ